MKRLKKFLINSFVLVFTSLILKFVSLYLNSYISSKVTTEAYGVFQLILSVYAFGITLASSGISLATTKIVSEELALNNKYCIKKISEKSIFLSLIFGIIASLIIMLSSNFITKYCFHNKVSSKIVYMIAIALPFISMSAAINGFFNAIRKVYKNAITQFFEQFIKIGFIFFLFSLILPLNVENACFSLILSDLISEVLSFTMLFIFYKLDKNIFSVKTNCFSHNNYIKRIFKISIPLSIASYLRSGLSTVKHVLIPSSLEKNGTECTIALSSYGIISGMSMQILMFPIILISSFSVTIIPEFARYYAKKDYKRIKDVSKFVIFLTFLFSLISAIIIYLFADKLSLFIFHNLDCAYYLKILSPVIIFIYIDSVCDSILKGIDAQVPVMIINIIDLIFTVSIIYFIVPLYGIKGYIISIYISETFNFSLSMLLLYIKTNKKLAR